MWKMLEGHGVGEGKKIGSHLKVYSRTGKEESFFFSYGNSLSVIAGAWEKVLEWEKKAFWKGNTAEI